MMGEVGREVGVGLLEDFELFFNHPYLIAGHVLKGSAKVV